MNKKEIFEKKFSLLRDEISILNQRINLAFDRIWKIRQLELTLWIATIGLGLGTIHQANKANPSILAISALLPIWFFIIESVYARSRRLFAARDHEIQKFLNNADYRIPGSNNKIEFLLDLKKDELNFPVYDLKGINTFCENGFYRWRKSIFSNFTISTPILLYGSQVIVSAYFARINYNPLREANMWWFPPASAAFIISILPIIGLIVRWRFLKIK